jgi:hypothetical protein
MPAFLRLLILHTPAINSIHTNAETRLSSTRNLRYRKFVMWILLCALIPEAGAQAGTYNDQLCLTSLAAVSSFAEAYKKRVLMLRRNETPDGERFTFTSDTSLDDYKSFVEGERIYVMIPQASFAPARSDPSGRGYTDLRIEQRDDDVMFSFRLQQGATVAVNQNFNRLEVVFITNERVNSKETR